ncbi:MAG: hypothetical protein NC905_00815 [Candidatus Omnitrophica bacterium]|nr:hypothetical protein [Candidatus Omnitrophota bacterium]MCM8776797.1 hypothetical protein [Candidatus Omnitrophota bacterium]
MKGKLVLENGERFEGNLFIERGAKTGMVVFDTRVVGYEKVLTSPEYCGKIVCFTYPLIGNYGINYEDIETDTIYPSGIVISEYSQIYSNFRARCSLKEFLKGKDINVIEGLDTQLITEIIRDNKGIKGTIAPLSLDEKEIFRMMKEDIEISIPVEEDVFIKKGVPFVAVINKIKKSELALLESLGIQIIFLSDTFPEVKDALSMAKVIYLSSFEDINSIKRTAEIIKEFIGKIPILGVGAGHLAVVLAMGGRIAEGKVNHYGTNHPVCDIKTGKKYITEQAHSLIVESKSIKNIIRFININDTSVEGIVDRDNKLISTTFQLQKEFIEEIL